MNISEANAAEIFLWEQSNVRYQRTTSPTHPINIRVGIQDFFGVANSNNDDLMVLFSLGV